MLRQLTGSLAAAALAAPSLAQDLIREHVFNTGFGDVVVAGLRDVDGDNIADYAAAAPGASGLGDISVFSGASGILLRALAGDAVTGPLGLSLADAGDVDGDGVLDLIVGGARGAAVFSIATGARLHWFSAPTAGTRVLVAGLDDIDGDSRGDLLLGVAAVRLVANHPGWGWNIVDLGPSYAEVRSGLTGGVIRTHFALSPASSYGGAVCALGDADGDGVSDYAVSTRLDPIATAAPVVDVFSGATGTLLRSLALNSAGLLDGAIAGIGDVDGDGLADIAIGEPSARRVRCVSIATGATLSTSRPVVPASPFEPMFGAYFAALGDVDLDGVSDLVVGVTSPPCYPGTPPCQSLLTGIEVSSGYSGANLLGYASGAGAIFNTQYAGVGDIDGDGRGELLTGEWTGMTPQGTYNGSARVRSLLTGFATPVNFCIPRDYQPNGQYTFITWGGTTSVSAADFELTAYDAPSAVFGYFLATRRSGAWTAGDMGLCVRPPGLRLAPPMPTDAQGHLSRLVFSSSSSAAFTAGTTWYFQFIYQASFGNTYSSDALAVTFAP